MGGRSAGESAIGLAISLAIGLAFAEEVAEEKGDEGKGGFGDEEIEDVVERVAPLVLKELLVGEGFADLVGGEAGEIGGGGLMGEVVGQDDRADDDDPEGEAGEEDDTPALEEGGLRNLDGADV